MSKPVPTAKDAAAVADLEKQIKAQKELIKATEGSEGDLAEVAEAMLRDEAMLKVLENRLATAKTTLKGKQIANAKLDLAKAQAEAKAAAQHAVDLANEVREQMQTWWGSSIANAIRTRKPLLNVSAKQSVTLYTQGELAAQNAAYHAAQRVSNLERQINELSGIPKPGRVGNLVKDTRVA